MGGLEAELSRSFLPSVFDPKGISSDQALQRCEYLSLVTLTDISAKTLLQHEAYALALGGCLKLLSTLILSSFILKEEAFIN